MNGAARASTAALRHSFWGDHLESWLETTVGRSWLAVAATRTVSARATTGAGLGTARDTCGRTCWD